MTETSATLKEQLNHPDHNMRSRAVLSLDNLDALLQALRSETDFYVQEDITWSLVRLGDAALNPLIGLLGDANPAVRHHAVHTLSKTGDVRAVDALIDALKDEDITVITKAVFALGQIGAVRAVPAIVELVGHENREVQTTVAAELGRFGKIAEPLLIRALDDERWQVREQAVDILGLIGNRAVIPVLIGILHDEQWQVRFAAVTALGYFGGASVREALQTMVNDPDQRVRGLTANVMRMMKR